MIGDTIAMVFKYITLAYGAVTIYRVFKMLGGLGAF